MQEQPLDWKAALDHFFERIRIYVDLLGQPGVATAPALLITFIPLLHRYIRGERTPDLYEEMTSVD